ncbi:MAG: biotin transporter BioY [Bdellovibrio sp.]|nr:biotin transporter BioY [Bdellovibrio sp.]
MVNLRLMTMNSSQALLPQALSKLITNSTFAYAAAFISGSALLALTAQLSIPLPFTPVPITGQTFGVALLALLWGRKRAAGAFALYLAEGAVGLPVFSQGKAFLTVGPTMGYLVGMLLATWIVGTLADRGYAKSFKGALLSAYAGSAIIFLCGTLGLSFFVPKEQVLIMGVFPFLIGDLVKNALAAGTVATFYRRSKST